MIILKSIIHGIGLNTTTHLWIQSLYFIDLQSIAFQKSHTYFERSVKCRVHCWVRIHTQFALASEWARAENRIWCIHSLDDSSFSSYWSLADYSTIHNNTIHILMWLFEIGLVANAWCSGRFIVNSHRVLPSIHHTFTNTHASHVACIFNKQNALAIAPAGFLAFKFHSHCSPDMNNFYIRIASDKTKKMAKTGSYKTVDTKKRS